MKERDEVYDEAYQAARKAAISARKAAWYQLHKEELKAKRDAHSPGRVALTETA